MDPTWAPPRPSRDVNGTGSMNLCQFEGRPALPPKMAFIQPPKNGSKTDRKIHESRKDLKTIDVDHLKRDCPPQISAETPLTAVDADGQPMGARRAGVWTGPIGI